MTVARDTHEYLDVWGVNPPPPMRVTHEYLDVWAKLTPEPPPAAAAPANVLARGGACYLDSFLEYDGRHVGTADGLFPGVTVRLTGGTTWLAGETVTLIASADVFTSEDVGNVVILHTSAGDLVRFTIATVVAGTPSGTTDVAVPTELQNTASTVWDRAVDVVGGLEHLEGATVGIVGDEHVVGSPYHAGVTLRVVTDGEVALGDFYSHVFVGLPYLSDLETLDIDKPAGSTLKGSKIDVTRVGLMVQQSRPVFVGGRPPVDDAVDPIGDLAEMPLPTDDNYEELVSDYLDINVKPEWNSNGRVFVRSIDPLPSTVLAIVAHGFNTGQG